MVKRLEAIFPDGTAAKAQAPAPAAARAALPVRCQTRGDQRLLNSMSQACSPGCQAREEHICCDVSVRGVWWRRDQGRRPCISFADLLQRS